MSVDLKSDQSSKSQDPAASSKRRRLRGLWLVVAASFFTAAVMLGAMVVLVPMGRDEALGWITLVIGEWIPTWWTVEVVLVALGLGSLLTARILAPPLRARGSRASRAVLVTAAVVAVSGSMLAVGASNISQYSLLPERSEGGCRIAVQEHSFLYAGWGSVGIVQPGSVNVDWLGRYGADDGYMPFSRGTYAVDWQGREAGIEVWGDASNPTWWLGDDPVAYCSQ